MRISPEDPDWTAPTTGWDWQDEKVLLASAWFAELANRRNWQKRVAATRDRFFAAKDRWAKGEVVAFYDPSVTAAWYLFQANAYATDRENWVPEQAVRVAPTFTRIGEELTALLAIPGTEDRAARLMNSDRSQPDGGLFFGSLPTHRSLTAAVEGCLTLFSLTNYRSALAARLITFQPDAAYRKDMASLFLSIKPGTPSGELRRVCRTRWVVSHAAISMLSAAA